MAKTIRRMSDVPKESDVKRVLRMYRQCAKHPERKSLLIRAEQESLKVNFVDLVIEEYGKILDKKSDLSSVEKKQVAFIMNSVIDYKNAKNEEELNNGSKED